MNTELNNSELKELGYSIRDFDDSKIDAFIQFASHFPKSGKAPKGMKKEKENVEFMHRMADLYKESGLVSFNLPGFLSHYQDKESMDLLIDSFTLKDKMHKLKMGRVTFVNESSMGNKRFESTSKDIFSTLKSLKGFHRKIIDTPIEIHFKKSGDLRAKAQYKGEKDQLWIKDSAKIDPEERYGYLQYIIIHELGHRFEGKHGHPDGFNEYSSYTTKYSRVDNMSGNEAFAELFALSHWDNKYPEYADKINKFKKDMNEHFMGNEKSMDF
jgi:hypothetical protein